MEPTRLIIAPQMRVPLRYQEWWPGEMVRQLQDAFEDVILLGPMGVYMGALDGGSFSAHEAAVNYEIKQMQDYMDLDARNSVLLHCDLSYPGLFHGLLAHNPPAKSVVFCHATSKNRFDLFEPIRAGKWPMEKGAAALYDKVLVATRYHADKLGFPNVRVMGALPNPSVPPPSKGKWAARPIRFASVARPSPQKVNDQVEDSLTYISGDRIVRPTDLASWGDYYGFLDRARFLIITAREETYGYQVVDAILRGCVPVAPRAFSYPELLSDTLLYPDKGSAADRAAVIMEIVHREEANPTRPRLKCDNNARAFWKNLIKELKT